MGRVGTGEHDYHVVGRRAACGRLRGIHRRSRREGLVPVSGRRRTPSLAPRGPWRVVGLSRSAHGACQRWISGRSLRPAWLREVGPAGQPRTLDRRPLPPRGRYRACGSRVYSHAPPWAVMGLLSGARVRARASGAPADPDALQRHGLDQAMLRRDEPSTRPASGRDRGNHGSLRSRA